MSPLDGTGNENVIYAEIVRHFRQRHTT
jgi:hypothetical protein